MSSLFTPLALAHGPALRNRFFLAPLTNCQSHVDGTLSDDEYRWLTLRAQGGFAVTTTCASHVQSIGQGFPGQLGNYSEAHLPGLQRLAAGIRQAGSLAVTQLHHAGIRAPRELTGTRPVGPSEDAESGARALSAGEVEQVAEDFIVAAQRADRAGFDGIEVHGAHGYLLCQFLSAEANRREDRYGGSLENRARLLFDVVTGIRTRCREGFVVGVRLSPERFGLKVTEIQAVAQRLMREGAIDYLNLSLWDIFKEPADEALRGRSLLSYFVELERGAVRIGAAGKIMSGPDAAACLAAGADFAIIGRAAILHHDFPERVRADPGFRATATPVTERYLRAEGLGTGMIEYMRRWEGFVEA